MSTIAPPIVGATSLARWYAVHSKPRQEARALENLERLGYDTYLPMRPVERVCRGRLTERLEPLFPRYLFVRLNDLTSNWMPIRSAWGVSRMVQFGERFAWLPDEAIAAMRTLQSTVRPLFLPGDRLDVTDGPFRGLEAVYAEPDGEARVVVLMNLLGRLQRLSLPATSLSTAT